MFNFLKRIWRRFFPKEKRAKLYTHRNPDGSEGGQVEEGAIIGKNVTIGKTSFVLAGSFVPDDTEIELGVIYTSYGEARLDE